MELPMPKAKNYCKLPKNLPLPIILTKDGSVKKISAKFNGFSVIVDDPGEMKVLISMGYFGKASFSRSYPQFTRPEQVEIIRNRQFVHRNNVSNKSKPDKIIVVPDSDSDDDHYFTNLQPKYEIDYSGIKENVWLGLEEAFFLAHQVNCLNICYKNENLSSENLWQIFSKVQPNFVRNYMVYFYYKAKNWVVKPGLKFGGDFVLYKEGPPFYHATYIVIIEVVDANGDRIESLTEHKMDNVSILGLNRLCETAGKELLICRIKWPDSTISYEDMTNIKIKEILLRRWNPANERQEMNIQGVPTS